MEMISPYFFHIFSYIPRKQKFISLNFQLHALVPNATLPCVLWLLHFELYVYLSAKTSLKFENCTRSATPQLRFVSQEHNDNWSKLHATAVKNTSFRTQLYLNTYTHMFIIGVWAIEVALNYFSALSHVVLDRLLNKYFSASSRIFSSDFSRHMGIKPFPLKKSITHKSKLWGSTLKSDL